MKKIVATGPGDIEVLALREVNDPTPGAEEVLIRLEAIGVNFADIYARRSAVPNAPMGREGAGVVEDAGKNITEFTVGDRVAFADTLGAYAEKIVVSANRLVPIPENLSTKQAAAALLQGMTAHYLASSAFPLKKGATVLVHAAAGGVGELLIQIAKMRGAKVFGTVSTPEKAKIAKEAGAHEVIIYSREDFPQKIKDLTGGKGVDVVYDSVGKDTFLKSLDCLRVRGTVVLFGQSSGPVEPVDTTLLVQKGSLTLARVSLKDYTVERSELLSRASEIFGWIVDGKLKLRIFKEFPLEKAADGQKILEKRETVGKVLLMP